MPKYRVLKKSFIDNRIVEEGEIIEFAGVPHTSNLEAIDKAGEKAVVSGASADDLARQHSTAQTGEPGNVAAVEAPALA